MSQLRRRTARTRTLRRREIDIRPQCHGIWLDRGELDKLITREVRYYEDDEDEWDERGRNALRRHEERPSSDRSGSLQRRKKKGFFQTMMENFSEGGEGGID